MAVNTTGLPFQQAPILREVNIQREFLTGVFERRLNKAEAEKALDRWMDHIKTLKLKGLTTKSKAPNDAALAFTIPLACFSIFCWISKGEGCSVMHKP